MKKIDSKQLAYVLGMTHKKAKVTMLRAKNPSANEEQIEVDFTVSDVIEMNIDDFEKATGIQLRMAVDDIVNNTLKRAASRKRILQDYPLSKLKTEKPPKQIRLPAELRSMLSDEDLKEIESYWRMNHGGKRFSEWADSVNYYPEMNP